MKRSGKCTLWEKEKEVPRYLKPHVSIPFLAATKGTECIRLPSNNSRKDILMVLDYCSLKIVSWAFYATGVSTLKLKLLMENRWPVVVDQVPQNTILNILYWNNKWSLSRRFFIPKSKVCGLKSFLRFRQRTNKALQFASQHLQSGSLSKQQPWNVL